MAQLDVHSSQLIKVIRAKGGATRQKIANIMDTLDQDCGADDVQRDLEQVTMTVFVIRKEGEGLQEPPADVGIVIEGVEVLHELTSVASARALLLDSDTEFCWTEDEVADLYNNTSFIIAADVCYDDDLTDGLFRTLYRLCNNFHHTCTIIISLERRLNFTLRHMDVSCEAYDHFRKCLSQLQELVDGRCSFKVEPLPSNFSQFLLYERIEQLEMWKVTTYFHLAKSDF
ncbi:methyltransferase-like protein 22 isoform X2 [Larimichthys crocea]|uniref:methyltransferase-like protein 22 isoform X2 n=1 Tax=Larimichthys crocea TaxID=215358 RepID=UPI000F5E5E43|nr:methyltransferase-like protein 22 isoform X2 [Larimichthys crocea]